MREYVPGDSIKFTIELEHKVQIEDEEIWAYFEFEGEEQTNKPRFGFNGIDMHQHGEGDRKVSRVSFESENPIGMDIKPGGIYRLTRVMVQTYGGRSMEITTIPEDIYFRVLAEEPLDEPPTISGFRWDT